MGLGILAASADSLAGILQRKNHLCQGTDGIHGKIRRCSGSGRHSSQPGCHSQSGSQFISCPRVRLAAAPVPPGGFRMALCQADAVPDAFPNAAGHILRFRKTAALLPGNRHTLHHGQLAVQLLVAQLHLLYLFLADRIRQHHDRKIFLSHCPKQTFQAMGNISPGMFPLTAHTGNRRDALAVITIVQTVPDLFVNICFPDQFLQLCSRQISLNPGPQNIPYGIPVINILIFLLVHRPQIQFRSPLPAF